MFLSVMGSAEAIAQLITVLFLFVLILAMTYFTTRWIAKYQTGYKKRGSNINIIETCAVGNGKYIQIIRIAGKYMAILVCKDTATFLGELSEDDINFPKKDGDALPSFKELLKRAGEFRKNESKEEHTDCEEKKNQS